MIDDKELSLREISALWASENKSFPMRMSITKLDAIELAEIIRDARRYLVLRNAGALIVGGLQMSEYAHGSALDAAADRLLEGGG